MQKISTLASLVFCLVSALFLAWEVPASGQNNNSNSNIVASLPADANSRISVDRDYKLTVSEIQKLYRQSTDGMSPNNTVTQNPATIMYSRGPVVPLSALRLSPTMLNALSTGVPTQGLPLTDTAFKAQLLQTQQQLLSQISDPVKNIPKELAQQLATQTMLGNSAAQVATAQANSAINYAGKYLINFTVNEGNVWNRLRNNIFVPIAILLLVPGTILTQTKSLMSAGNPVIEFTNPFEGILRAVIAMCFIPGSYLVVNYGIDFSNSISHTIQDAYRTQFGSDMYADAFLAEQRAFPSRQAAENQNGLSGLFTGATAVGGNQVSGFAQLENDLFKNKAFAADGTQVAVNGLVDEVMPANAVAARMAIFGTNMLVTSIWDLLCAFQLVYLHYLFLVGPIMAAIWVYPIKQLREAWPNWVAGTITLCFWSLFWNTAILLMALFKDADSTGTFIMTALNLLATGSVKYAFDFVGLITEAGQEAAKTARQNTNQTSNLTNPAGATTEKTKTQNTETKGDGGGLLGGLTKIATTSILTAAAPGAGQALSLGSQLLGGLGGSKDGNSSGGLGEFAKSLSLPPMVSSVAESAFPASAAAFGIVSAAGLLGKEEVSLPPLAGGAKAGGAIGALASAESALTEDAPSKGKKKTGGLGIETVLGGIEDVVENAESISGGVGAKNGLGGLTAASGLTGSGNLTNMTGLAASAGAEGSLDALTGAAGGDKSAATMGASGLLGICGAGRAARPAGSMGSLGSLGSLGASGASRFVGSSKESESIGATNVDKSILIAAAMQESKERSIFEGANGSNEKEVNSFMSFMAEAAGASGEVGHGATPDIDVSSCESVAVFGGAAAAVTEVGLPPSARISAHGHTGAPSAPSTRTNSLFKQGAHTLETTSARELTYSGSSQSNTVDLFREHTECEAVDAFSRAQLNFASAPPLASISTSFNGGPSPNAPAFAKLASSEAEYVAAQSQSIDIAVVAAPETGSSVVAFNAGSSDYLRSATINNTIKNSVFAQDESVDNATFEDTTSPASSTENSMFFAAAAAIDCTVTALPPHVKAATESNSNDAQERVTATHVSDTQFKPSYDLYMRPSTPDQNENTSGVLSYMEVQPAEQSRRPKTLQELMKPSAFERPCDTCKNLTCHCVFANPPAVGAWS